MEYHQTFFWFELMVYCANWELMGSTSRKLTLMVAFKLNIPNPLNAVHVRSLVTQMALAFLLICHMDTLFLLYPTFRRITKFAGFDVGPSVLLFLTELGVGKAILSSIMLFNLFNACEYFQEIVYLARNGWTQLSIFAIGEGVEEIRSNSLGVGYLAVIEALITLVGISHPPVRPRHLSRLQITLGDCRPSEYHCWSKWRKPKTRDPPRSGRSSLMVRGRVF